MFRPGFDQADAAVSVAAVFDALMPLHLCSAILAQYYHLYMQEFLCMRALCVSGSSAGGYVWDSGHRTWRLDDLK